MPPPQKPTVTPALYEDVRKLLGTDVTAAVLPDATLNLDVYKGATEAWVAATIPDVSGLSNEDEDHLDRAMACYMAALVAPALPSIIRMGDLGGLYEQREPVDREKQALFLFGRAEAELRKMAETIPIVVRPLPTLFITAPGRRGR